MRRFFIPPDQIAQSRPAITGSDLHHLRDVLRLRTGDDVELFDGLGHTFHARIISMDRDRARVSLIEAISTDIESPLSITLAQGLLKDKKMDVLVRQLTELGIARWSPFVAERSVPVPDKERIDARRRRWQKISLEAIKQCGRSRTMAVDPPVAFSQLLDQADGYDLRLMAWENPAMAIPLGSLEVDQPASVLLVIGPEGGFSPDEVAQAQGAGFYTVGLGPRILRAETAALAAAVTAQLIFGDMN